MKKLSICIPVFNNQSILRHCLRAACEACAACAQDVEIVVSDNHSEDDILAVFNSLSKEYPNVCMKFHRNNENIGMAGNFLQSVSIASGQFCWIVGSDDFLYSDSVQHLIGIIDGYTDIDFICCNYDLIEVNRWKPEFAVRERNDTRNNAILKHIAPEDSGLVDSLGDLILPETNNVYLGAMMTGIFRKSIWDKVDKNNFQLDGFKGLESTYPHCVIYARGFIAGKAYYCGLPLVIVGEGSREWSTDTGISFWKSSLPVIYFNILGNMLDEYYRNGLSKENYLACMKDNANRVGALFRSLMYMKLFNNEEIKNGELLNPIGILLKYGRFRSFYSNAFPIANRIKRKFGGARK